MEPRRERYRGILYEYRPVECPDCPIGMIFDPMKEEHVILVCASIPRFLIDSALECFLNLDREGLEQKVGRKLDNIPGFNKDAINQALKRGASGERIRREKTDTPSPAIKEGGGAAVLDDVGIFSDSKKDSGLNPKARQEINEILGSFE